MNNDRRKAISQIIAALEGILSDAENIRDDEWEYYDNMPEFIQSGDKGAVAKEVVNNLRDAVVWINDAISYAIEALNEARHPKEQRATAILPSHQFGSPAQMDTTEYPPEGQNVECDHPMHRYRMMHDPSHCPKCGEKL